VAQLFEVLLANPCLADAVEAHEAAPHILRQLRELLLHQAVALEAQQILCISIRRRRACWR